LELVGIKLLLGLDRPSFAQESIKTRKNILTLLFLQKLDIFAITDWLNCNAMLALLKLAQLSVQGYCYIFDLFGRGWRGAYK